MRALFVLMLLAGCQVYETVSSGVRFVPRGEPGTGDVGNADLAPGQQQPPPRDTRPMTAAVANGRISGLVTTDDAQPRPLRRARVTLTGPSIPLGRSVITADDGTFVFEGVPAGRFTVGALKDGYVPMNYGATRTGRPGRGVPLADGQTARVDIRLPRGAVITGTVLDVDGQPAQGVFVRVMARRFFSGEGDYRYMSVSAPGPPTDDRGVYRAFGLPAGEYYVAAMPGGGRGTPPGNVLLRLMTRGGPSEKPVSLAQVFHPDAIDVSRASRISVRAGEERAGVDIQLEYVPLATISGAVAVPAGWTALVVTMSRTDDSTDFPGGRAARAEADGRFTFAGVPPGVYRVAARIAATAPAPMPSGRGGSLDSSGPVLFATAEVAVAGEDILNLSLTPGPGLTVSGRVVFAGARAAPPLADMSISVPLFLTVADSGYPLPRVQLQAGGTFRIDNVIPGRYRGFNTPQGIGAPIGSWWLKSLAAGGRELLDAPIELRQSLSDVVLTLADDASALTGSVLDENRAPVPEGYVVAFSTDRAMWFLNSRRVTAVRVDRNGRYAIRNLPPGEYRVAAADLDQGEWFDAAVLERLVPASTGVILTGVERKTLDLAVR